MKKLMIGLIVGVVALSSALPVSAGGSYDSNVRSDESIWEIIDGGFGAPCGGSLLCSSVAYDDGILADLILIAGMATMLDTCGNGKPFYTLFAPIEVLNVGSAVGGVEGSLGSYLEDVLDATVADLQATPDVVRALLNDHLVNGSFSPWQLDLDEITTLTARSGFTLRNENGNTINDLLVLESEQACNGWIYFINGVLDSTPQVPTEGLNALDTPQDGTPGGSNSLPNTL